MYHILWYHVSHIIGLCSVKFRIFDFKLFINCQFRHTNTKLIGNKIVNWKQLNSIGNQKRSFDIIIWDWKHSPLIGNIFSIHSFSSDQNVASTSLYFYYHFIVSKLCFFVKNLIKSFQSTLFSTYVSTLHKWITKINI